MSHGQSVWNKVNPKIYLGRVEAAAGGGKNTKMSRKKRFKVQDEKWKKTHTKKRENVTGLDCNAVDMDGC